MLTRQPGTWKMYLPQTRDTTRSCFDGACPVVTNQISKPCKSSSSTNHPSFASAFPCARLWALPQPPGLHHCLFKGFLGFGHLGRSTGRPHIINRHMITRPCSNNNDPQRSMTRSNKRRSRLLQTSATFKCKAAKAESSTCHQQPVRPEP